MRVRIIIGAEAAYACISHQGIILDVRLEPGRSAAQSLRETAQEWRERAQRLQDRAALLSVAAAKLDEDEASGRRFSSQEAA